MRVVVALGGNALLRRGQALTAENQRENIRVAAEAMAPLAKEHQLVISHGNGPQVGLLALQGAAYKPDEAYPLDVLGAETEGMIGYMIEQELGNLLPSEVAPRRGFTATQAHLRDSPHSLAAGTTDHRDLRGRWGYTDSLRRRSQTKRRRSGDR